MPDERGRLRCGEFGHVGKNGKPCQYVIYKPATACLHHSEDKTFQTEVLERARRATKEAKIPDITTNDFRTLDDCLKVKAKIVEILCRDKTVDFRRLELALKCSTSASQDHATKEAARQNELLLTLSGHGAGVAMLQRLKDAPVRVLPGRRKTIDLAPIIDINSTSQEEGPEPVTGETPSTSETQEA